MVAAIPEARVETWFVIPLVRNSDRRPHDVALWGLLREEVYEVAGGVSGPRRVIALIEDVEPLPGSWRDLATGKPVEDESRKYTVIVAREKLDELRAIMERAANSFDQDEVLFVVQGVDQSVKRDPSKGFLKDDPSGG